MNTMEISALHALKNEDGKGECDSEGGWGEAKEGGREKEDKNSRTHAGLTFDFSNSDLTGLERGLYVLSVSYVCIRSSV